VDEAGTDFRNAAGEAVQLLPPLVMVLLPCVEVEGMLEAVFKGVISSSLKAKDGGRVGVTTELGAEKSTSHGELRTFHTTTITFCCYSAATSDFDPRLFFSQELQPAYCMIRRKGSIASRSRLITAIPGSLPRR
jgi:hypothetical protein